LSDREPIEHIEHDGKFYEPILYDLEQVADALERVAVAVRAGLCHEILFIGEGERGLIFFTGIVVIEDDESAEMIVYGNEVEEVDDGQG